MAELRVPGNQAARPLLKLLKLPGVEQHDELLHLGVYWHGVRWRPGAYHPDLAERFRDD